MAYQRKAETILQDENCFKVYIYKIDCRITIELLDTESDDNEKNAQNSKTWNSYVDRFTNKMPTNSTDPTNQSSGSIARLATNSSGETSLAIKEEKMDDDMISSLPRRQLFLHRNIRKFKLRNSSRKSSSPDLPSSLEIFSSKNINECGAKTPKASVNRNISVTSINIDGAQRNSDLDDPSKPTSNEVTETVSSAMSKSNSNDEISTCNQDLSSIAAELTEPQTSEKICKSQSIIEVKSRPLERTGKDCNEGYFIDDRSEININFQKYRMVFVVNKDAVFYKKSAIHQARKTHPKITKARAHKFLKFVKKWCDENVNEDQQKQCVDWFMGKQADQIPNIITIKVQENDLTKTPYALYNRYKVQHLNN